MCVDVVLGLQFGDEGKGKIVDYLSKNADVIARFQGGNNAGHTMYVDGVKYVLHILPSGALTPDKINVIGNGCVVDPLQLIKDIKTVSKINPGILENLFISNKAHLITPVHIEADISNNKIGTTGRGIGYSYGDKYLRRGITIGDFLNNFSESISRISEMIDIFFRTSKTKKEKIDLLDKTTNYLSNLFEIENCIIDTSLYLCNIIKNKNKKILCEGAQGMLLDIDHGYYPYVTSSNTTIGEVCSGLGIPASSIKNVYGVIKAYTTKVGDGPFNTEITGELAESLRKTGKEYGATTGRPRRIGWLDLPSLKKSIQINGVNRLVINKLDVFSDMGSDFVPEICISYNNNEEILNFNEMYRKKNTNNIQFNNWNYCIDENGIDINPELYKYVSFLKKELEINRLYLGHGPKREDLYLL